MNESQQIEAFTGAAQRIIASLQAAIFASMEAAATSVQDQVRIASAFRKLEASEAVLDWLVARRIEQEQRLSEADLRPAQQALIRRKIAQIDEELGALLRSSGIEDQAASHAVATVTQQPRSANGRFLPRSNGQ